MYDIIIIGAGPAGLTAALYAARSNKKILVLEGSSYGGQIVKAHKIDNYPALPHISGFDFATNLYNQVKELGVKIVYETVLSVNANKEVKTNKNTYSAKAVIIATGAENKKLNLPNEKELIGKGISYCATCDGHFYKGKVVAVVGSHHHALVDADVLTNLAKKVYLISNTDEFTGNEKIVEDLKNKGVEFICNHNITKINGTDKLDSITLDDDKQVELDGLFIAVGGSPKNDIFSDVVDLDENGYIITHDDVYTRTPGIYVAGDARYKTLRQLTTASSDGSIAAISAIKDIK